MGRWSGFFLLSTVIAWVAIYKMNRGKNKVNRLAVWGPKEQYGVSSLGFFFVSCSRLRAEEAGKAKMPMSVNERIPN